MKINIYTHNKHLGMRIPTIDIDPDSPTFLIIRAINTRVGVIEQRSIWEEINENN